MKTIVKDLQTNEEHVFVNTHSVVQNVINAILVKTKRTGQLCNDELRAELIQKYGLKQFCSKNGLDYVCFCEEFELFARQPIGEKIDDTPIYRK